MPPESTDPMDTGGDSSLVTPGDAGDAAVIVATDRTTPAAAVAKSPVVAAEDSWWSCVIGSLLSVGFWSSLLVAASLFAVVVLSPRVVAYVALEREFFEAQQKLISLQQQVRQMERVEQGMQHDARFVAEVARQELDSTHPHDLLLSVSPELKFDALRPQSVPPPAEYHEAWYLPQFRALQQDSRLRQRLCLYAAGLLVFGFVLLHDGPGPRRVVQLIAEPLRQLLIRYRASSLASEARESGASPAGD